MRLSDRAEQLLNVANGQQVFVVVNKQQQQDVLLAVFFADRSWEQTVLGVVVDHGLGKSLVLRAALGLF